jgi:hypothetical protein
MKDIPPSPFAKTLTGHESGTVAQRVGQYLNRENFLGVVASQQFDSQPRPPPISTGTVAITTSTRSNLGRDASAALVTCAAQTTAVITSAWITMVQTLLPAPRAFPEKAESGIPMRARI